MSKQEIQGLLTDISEHFTEQPASDQQKQLLEGVERHIHDWDEPDVPDPDFKETMKLLLVEFEEEHPKLVATAEEIIDVLGKMGL